MIHAILGERWLLFSLVVMYLVLGLDWTRLTLLSASPEEEAKHDERDDGDAADRCADGGLCAGGEARG